MYIYIYIYIYIYLSLTLRQPSVTSYTARTFSGHGGAPAATK